MKEKAARMSGSAAVVGARVACVIRPCLDVIPACYKEMRTPESGYANDKFSSRGCTHQHGAGGQHRRLKLDRELGRLTVLPSPCLREVTTSRRR